MFRFLINSDGRTLHLKGFAGPLCGRFLAGESARYLFVNKGIAGNLVF